MLQNEEIQAASREAVGAHGLRMALGAFSFAALAVGAVWNLVTSASRISSLTSALALPLVLWSLETTRYPLHRGV